MKRNKLFTSKNLVLIGMLAALSAILMLFQIPTFFAPNFYKLDLSELPVLIGSFAIHPLAGIPIAILKNIINIALDGTTTMYIGELANLIASIAFAVPAGIIYHRKKCKKTAIKALIIGSLSMSFVSCFTNIFLTIPAYVFLNGFTVEQIVALATALNPAIKNFPTFIALAVLPFNLLKCALTSVATLIIYKYISKYIHNYTN